MTTSVANGESEDAVSARLRARITAGMTQTQAELESLVRIPGCAFPGFPPAEIERVAQRVAAILRDAGCARVDIIDNGDNPPAVYAEAPGPVGSPTVLLYAHYDVQPAGDLAAWTSPPFEPSVRDGRLYGRGAADDKSGVVLHAAAIRAFDGHPPCTVRVIIEGDEEYGGSFEDFPRQHPEMFAADAIIIADTGNIEVGVPSFTSALRGMAMVTVSVATLADPVHSGMFGGPAPDALMVLITLLATLRDSAGDTSIPGVSGYDWTGADFDEQLFRDQAGILAGQPLTGTGSLASRLYSQPVASVVGIDAPAVDGAINAVVPRARAKVSLRVPPGTDPKQAQQALTAYLVAQAPWGVHVEVEAGVTGDGYLADTSGPIYTTMAAAMRTAYGADTVELGSGGSIPLVSVLTEVSPDATILLVGAQDLAAAIHAPDESVDLGELRDAALAEALFVHLLADHRNGSGQQ